MKNILKKIIIIFFITFFIIIFSWFFNKLNKIKINDNIKVVKNIIKIDNETLKCISDCQYLYTQNGNEYTIYDNNGNSVFNYESINEEPILVTKKYYITVKNDNYILRNKKGEIYTDKKIIGLNEYLVFSSNNILNYKGDKILNDVIVDNYSNENYIGIKKDNKYVIIDKTGEIILENYIIDYNSKYNFHNYLILKNLNDNQYYYFDLILEKIIGKGFFSYDFENKKLIVKIKEGKTISKYQVQDSIFKEIVSFNFNLKLEEYLIFYDYIESKDQSNVFVSKINDNSFGYYDIKKNKYILLVDNLKSIKKINSDLFIINEKIVFNLTAGKKIYEKDGISYYKKLDENKIVKINNKYYVLDKNNEIILSSSRKIYFYKDFNNIKTKENFDLFINNKKSMKNVRKIKVNNNDYLIYNNALYDELLTKLINEKFSCTSKNIITFFDEKVEFNFLNKRKTKTYYLEKDETYKDKDELIFSPFKNVFYVENKEKSYIKIIGNDGNVIKKINNANIESINNTLYGKNVIIVKKVKGEAVLFGAYVLE